MLEAPNFEIYDFINYELPSGYREELNEMIYCPPGSKYQTEIEGTA